MCLGFTKIWLFPLNFGPTFFTKYYKVPDTQNISHERGKQVLTVNVTQYFFAFSTAGESCRDRVELLIISVSCETGMGEEPSHYQNSDSQRYVVAKN